MNKIILYFIFTFTPKCLSNSLKKKVIVKSFLSIIIDVPGPEKCIKHSGSFCTPLSLL